MERLEIYVKYRNSENQEKLTRFILEMVDHIITHDINHTGDEWIRWGNFSENFWFAWYSGISERDTIRKAISKIRSYFNKKYTILGIQYQDGQGNMRYFPKHRPINPENDYRKAYRW